MKPGATLDEDVVICGDDAEAKARVVELTRLIPNLRPVDGGALYNAKYVEQITPLLVNINRIYRTHSGGADHWSLEQDLQPVELGSGGTTMPRATLDLQNADDLASIGGQWKCAHGFVPGEPNEGVVSEAEGSPCRLPDFDDSGWGSLRRPGCLAAPGCVIRLVSDQGHAAGDGRRPAVGGSALPV